MAFDIGRVLSPEVAAALIRRSENTGGGAFIKRDPKTVRRSSEGNADATLGLLREKRMARQQELDSERQDERERFEREKYEFGKSIKEREFDEREEARQMQGRKIGVAEKNQQRQVREQGQKILTQMGSILARARKVNPDTGRPDPAAIQEAQTVAAALWSQFQNLGLPPEEVEAAMQQMQALLPMQPASRAPGIQRGSAQGPAIPPTTGGVGVDPTLARDLGLGP